MQVISLSAIIFIAIDAGSGGENEVLAGVLLHHLHQVDGASNVVFEVHDGVFHGLPDCLLGCKMHDALDRLPAVFLGLENCLELANVHNVHFMELDT